MHFGGKFIKQKLLGTPNLGGGRSPYRTPNLNLEEPGPSVTYFQGDFIKFFAFCLLTIDQHLNLFLFDFVLTNSNKNLKDCFI